MSSGRPECGGDDVGSPESERAASGRIFAVLIKEMSLGIAIDWLADQLNDGGDGK